MCGEYQSVQFMSLFRTGSMKIKVTLSLLIIAYLANSVQPFKLIREKSETNSANSDPISVEKPKEQFETSMATSKIASNPTFDSVDYQQDSPHVECTDKERRLKLKECRAPDRFQIDDRAEAFRKSFTVSYR